MLEFAKNFFAAFAIFALGIFGIALVAIGPIVTMILLGVKPLPFGLPLIALSWAAMLALAFAVSEHNKTPGGSDA